MGCVARVHPSCLHAVRIPSFSLLLVQLTTERYITLAIAKKGPQEHWPRLLKAAGKPAPNIKVRVHGSCDRVSRWIGLWLECSVERCTWLVQTAWGVCYLTSRKVIPAHSTYCFALSWIVQVDWDKWVDEDEEEEGDDKMGGFDLSQLQNFAVRCLSGTAECLKALARLQDVCQLLEQAGCGCAAYAADGRSFDRLLQAVAAAVSDAAGSRCVWPPACMVSHPAVPCCTVTSQNFAGGPGGMGGMGGMDFGGDLSDDDEGERIG